LNEIHGLPWRVCVLARFFAGVADALSGGSVTLAGGPGAPGPGALPVGTARTDAAARGGGAVRADPVPEVNLRFD
jgi:hypothetical protein